MERGKWQCSRLIVSPRGTREVVLSQTAGPFGYVDTLKVDPRVFLDFL